MARDSPLGQTFDSLWFLSFRPKARRERAEAEESAYRWEINSRNENQPTSMPDVLTQFTLGEVERAGHDKESISTSAELAIEHWKAISPESLSLPCAARFCRI